MADVKKFVCSLDFDATIDLDNSVRLPVLMKQFSEEALAWSLERAIAATIYPYAKRILAADSKNRRTSLNIQFRDIYKEFDEQPLWGLHVGALVNELSSEEMLKMLVSMDKEATIRLLGVLQDILETPDGGGEASKGEPKQA